MTAIPNRRQLLLGAVTAGAAATVAAIPAIAAAEPPDPVLALIEAHKAATARYDELDLAGLDDKAAHAAEVEVAEAADAAIDELTDTPPTTIAGMRAAIEYLLEQDGGHYDYLPALLRSSLLRSPLLAG
jgi:hypothetical protein